MNPVFEITLFECSPYLGAFKCPRCGEGHNVELSRVEGFTLKGFCPIERERIEFRITARIPLDQTPPTIKATAVQGRE